MRVICLQKKKKKKEGEKRRADSFKKLKASGPVYYSMV